MLCRELKTLERFDIVDGNIDLNKVETYNLQIGKNLANTIKFGCVVPIASLLIADVQKVKQVMWAK